MRRGEIWPVLADGYARKPRPVVVVQNDEIEGFDSTVVCLMTSFTSDDMTTRVKVPPTTQNGLIKKLGDDGVDSCSAHFGIGPTHWNFGR